MSEYYISVKETMVRSIYELHPGDHIAFGRDYVLAKFTHHAIIETVDYSNNKFIVIEYTGSIIRQNGHFASVRSSEKKFKSDLDTFLVVYEDGCCFEASVTTKRARSRLNEANYGVFNNNCEHFATWCKTGIKYNLQIASRVLERTSSAATKHIKKAAVTPIVSSALRGSGHVNRLVPLAAVGKKMVVVNPVGAAVGVAIDTVSYATNISQHLRDYTDGSISEDVFVQRMGVEACEFVPGVAGGVAGSVIGQILIPIPALGAVIGGATGNIVGRFVGGFLGRKIDFT